eukprot:g8179.t1
MWRHDFWGQQMTDPASHKSFRPLTTLSYRLSNVLAQRMFAEEQENKSGSRDQMTEKDGVVVGPARPKASPVNKTHVVRGAGPELVDATGYHLVNVVVHAATCSSSVRLFRAVFAAEELPALAASLLFTVHPVHVEAVAPIVGRADLLCGFLSVIALTLAIAGTRARGNVPGNGLGDESGVAVENVVTTLASCSAATAESPPQNDVLGQADAAAKRERAAAFPGPPTDRETVEEEEEEESPPVAATATVNTATNQTVILVTSAPEKTVGRVSADKVGHGSQGGEEDERQKQEGQERKRREGLTAHRREGAAETTPSPLPSEGRPEATVAGMSHPEEQTRTEKLGAAAVVEEKETGPGMPRFCAALLFAAGATLCKEVGVTVFGLMAGGELVRFFEAHGRGQRQRCRRQGPRPAKLKAGNGEVSRGTVVRKHLWHRLMTRVPLAAATRAVSAAVGATTMVVLHVRLHGGAGVREWGILENDISILASRKERALSYAFTHAMYTYKLLWPAKLSYDWGFSCIPHVTSLADPVNLGPLTLYTSILWATIWAVVHRDAALMWALAFLVLPFLPASNLFFPVGAVMAERLLYLPSLGACVLAGCLLRRHGTIHGSPPSCAPDGGQSSSPSVKRDVLPIHEDEEDEEEEEEREYDGIFSPLCPRSPRKPDGSPVLLERQEREQQQGPPPPPPPPPPSLSPWLCPSLSMASSGATRAPACSSSSVLLPPLKQEHAHGTARTRKFALRSFSFPTKRTVVMMVLMSWAAFFGEGTVRRCREWNSERVLFEAALKVCPDGIKTLNNVAVGMLNEAEAALAEEHLRRAVELHPEYGSAMFNLGVSLMLNRDLVGAVLALERSLELEPRNTKIMVYLGKVYVALTWDALENQSELAGQENVDVGFKLDDAQGDDGREGESNAEAISKSVLSLSPEALLSRAETYIDRALAAGSGLPLSRLVKGHTLALRGQHENAAGFFQASIEISLDLLAGRTTSGGGGRRKTESMVMSDAVDLASTYNRLGLALRDSGTDAFAAKEAFLAGLSAAPDDLALLVNGGVAHQAAGDIPGAKALYHRALSLEPNSPELLNNVGYLEEQTGGGSRTSIEKAAALYSRALELLDAGSHARAQVEINLKNAQKGLAMETPERDSINEPAQGRELVAGGRVRNSGGGDYVGRPLLVIRFQSGQQLLIDSWQSLFRLYITASAQHPPVQLRVLHSAAQQFLRCQAGAVVVRGRQSNTNSNTSFGISARLVGSSAASVSGTTAAANNMTIPLRTFFMAPVRLRSVSPASIDDGDGGGRMITYHDRQSLVFFSSTNDNLVIYHCEQRFDQQEQRQLSSVVISADMSLTLQVFNSCAMWRYPCRLPCELVALSVEEESIVVRPITFLIASTTGRSSSSSSSSTRGRTMRRTPYKVTPVDSAADSVASTATPGITSTSTSSSSSPASRGRMGFKTIGGYKEDSQVRDDQDKRGFGTTNDVLAAPPSATLSLGTSSSVATFTAATRYGPKPGAPSRKVGSLPTAHGRPHEKLQLHKGGDPSATAAASSPLAGPTSVEEYDRRPPTTSRARSPIRKRVHTAASGGCRRGTSSRSPSPVRAGEAMAPSSPTPRRDSRVAPVVPQVDGRVSQVCSPFKAGDRVTYIDQCGVEERGVVLTVYPNDGRCKIQADSTYNVTASDLSPNQADRGVASSFFELGDKVISSDQHGVEDPDVSISGSENDGYEFRADGSVLTVDASSLVLDKASPACPPSETDERMVFTDQAQFEEPEVMSIKNLNNYGCECQADDFGSVGTVDASDLLSGEAGWVIPKADSKVTGKGEAVATAILRSTPPLTPDAPCSASATHNNTSGIPDTKEFFGSSHEQEEDRDRDDWSNDDGDEGEDEGDDEGDSTKGNGVDNPSLSDDGDGGGCDDRLGETTIEALPHACVATFGCGLSPLKDDDNDDEEDGDAQAAGYLTATGLNMELLESEGENTGGGFGDVIFVRAKKTDDRYAFKKAKNTGGGRRQMLREVQVLLEIDGKVSHIVNVEEIRLEPLPMLLMRKEPGTLSSMLEDASNSVPREVVKVLCGVLTAIGEIHGNFGYLHRDIKPDNILVDQYGDGKLTDFGMCIKARDASRRENIGDGTPEYCAPETSTLRGASVASEVYAVAVIFVEALANNCPFGSKELLEAAADRLSDLEEKRDDLVELVEIEKEMEDGGLEGEEEEGEGGDDGKNSGEKSARERLELVRIKGHRLGVVDEDGWDPNDAALVMLAEMGPPLNFFMAQPEDDTRSMEKRGVDARREAQANPRKLFEDNWVEWLTTFSRAACDEGLRQAVDLVLDRGMLDPDPESRPQTAEAAKKVLQEALAVYEAVEAAAEEVEE